MKHTSILHTKFTLKNFPVKMHKDSEAGWKVWFPPLTVTFVTQRTAKLSHFLTEVLHYSTSSSDCNINKY